MWSFTAIMHLKSHYTITTLSVLKEYNMNIIFSTKYIALYNNLTRQLQKHKINALVSKAFLR